MSPRPSQLFLRKALALAAQSSAEGAAVTATTVAQSEGEALRAQELEAAATTSATAIAAVREELAEARDAVKSESARAAELGAALAASRVEAAKAAEIAAAACERERASARQFTELDANGSAAASVAASAAAATAASQSAERADGGASGPGQSDLAATPSGQPSAFTTSDSAAAARIARLEHELDDARRTVAAGQAMLMAIQQQAQAESASRPTSRWAWF